MCGMYIINGVDGPGPRSSGGNTSSNPQVSALNTRPALIGMERMCQRHGSNQNSHPPVLVRKPLCNQCMPDHISSRGVLGINHFKLRNFAVIAIECYFSTVDRGSIMTRIHGWNVLFRCFEFSLYRVFTHISKILIWLYPAFHISTPQTVLLYCHSHRRSLNPSYGELYLFYHFDYLWFGC